MTKKRNIYDLQANYEHLQQNKLRPASSGTSLELIFSENQRLHNEVWRCQLEIKRLHEELAEAEKELEMLRPMGIVWRAAKDKKKKDD